MISTGPSSYAALLTIEEVKTRLGISDKTVRRLIKRGDMPVIRIGRQLRVSEADLQRFLNECRLRPNSSLHNGP
jgi:putative molybdopterin biosynthesis protein